MANIKDDYLISFREFFENFAKNVDFNDQLPVKLASYKLINLEVIGAVIDWTTQYLTQKKCPQSLMAPLIQIVIEEIRKCCKKQPTSFGFNPSDNAYEPLKLMQAVVAKTNEICLRYTDNSMLCSLPFPNHTYNITSVYAMKNTRRKMEDRHVVINDLNGMFNIQGSSPSSYYAIFDGHAGHDAAVYSAAHLHQYLTESQYFINDPEQAFLEAFSKTDKLFLEKCRIENLNSGTTAVCALLRPKLKTLYIAWVGDSQALLAKPGQILQCVQPHKPSREDEKARIERQGGQVMFWGTWRVDGQLAVSRAIGNLLYKDYVISEPDILSITLEGDEDFLILACDGMWDYLSEENAANTVYEMVCQNPDETEKISEQLVHLSKTGGSTDNISVIIVFLREPSKIAANYNIVFKMDASLDNANNPFTISNGTNKDTVLSTPPKTDGLLINLTENFKQNGNENLLSAGDYYHNNEKSNGKRLVSPEFNVDDEDLGPETNVDTVDDINLSSSIMTTKAFLDEIINNNPNDNCNPFIEKEQVEKAIFEKDIQQQKQQSIEFDEQRSPREETPTPPADVVHDGGLVDNIADSGEDSEDEWNYIKGEEANKENIDLEVSQITEEADNMSSQLNPNAAEFVPISPTRSIPTPPTSGRTLNQLNDEIISQSPKRPKQIEKLPTDLDEFEKELKSKPAEIDTFNDNYQNENERSTLNQHETENVLNGKDVDDISNSDSPDKVPSSSPLNEEFHFGPNSTPFAQSTLCPDQNETNFSTKAVCGDTENISNIESFCMDLSNIDNNENININNDIDNKEKNESVNNDIDDNEEINQKVDPMSMSIYQDSDDDSIDLNKIRKLPDNIDEFLDTKSVELNLEKIQTTDLDKDYIIDNNEKESEPPNDDDLQQLLNNCEVEQEFCSSEKLNKESSFNNITDEKNEEINLSKIEIESCNIFDSNKVSSEGNICKIPKNVESSENILIDESILKLDNKDNECKLEDPIEYTHEVVTLEPESKLLEEVLHESESPSPMPELISDVTETSEKSDTGFCEFKSKDGIESPFHEDVTSSIKDVKSPILLSPLSEQISVSEEIPIEDNPVISSSPLKESYLQLDDSVDVNSFLERTQLPDLTSPLNSTISAGTKCAEIVCPISIEISTEKIEEIKTDVIVPEMVKDDKEPEIVKSQKVNKEPKIVKKEETVKSEKPLSASKANKTPTMAKTNATKKPASPIKSKTLTAKPLAIAKTSKLTSTASVASKTVSNKTNTTANKLKSTPSSLTTTSTITKLSPKPKVPITNKITEKKPLTNGDVKPSVESNLKAGMKGTKSTLSKITSSRPITAPVKSTSTSTNPTATRPKTATANVRPLTVSTKSTALTLTSKPATATLKASPKPRSSPSTATAPSLNKVKPKVPLTKPINKTTETEKQSKDNANKLTAASRTTATTTTRNHLSAINKKSDVTKTSGGGTTTRTLNSKTTSTTTKSTSSKKVGTEAVTRISKTTKIEKSQENGSSHIVTEQILINNEINECEPQLIKDNSPVDNKLLVDTKIAD